MPVFCEKTHKLLGVTVELKSCWMPWKYYYSVTWLTEGYFDR